MIGKPQWFKYRIFGWGLAPKTWQGWAYVSVFIALVLTVSFLPIQENIKQWIIGVILFVMIADVIMMMTQLSKVSDERDNYHQLIIERNASFAAIAALLCVIIFQSYKNTGSLMSQNSAPFDTSLLIVLGAMLAAKIATTIYVKMKM
jgi:hypothetical protein